MRIRCLLALCGLLLSISAYSADAHSFGGTWSEPLCAAGDPEKCGGFSLYLVQKGERICGDHFAASPGLGRLNEGGPKSVIGTVVDRTAVVTITSGRDGSVLLVRINRTPQGLRWKVVEEVKDGGFDGPLVPISTTLIPEKSKELERVTEECEEVLRNAR